MILITGSNGMVGSHLLYYFAQKKVKVKAIIRDSSKINSIIKTFSFYTENPEKLTDHIEWHIGDITDIASMEDALAGIDKVYHTAAYISFNPRNKYKVLETNIKGTANLVNLCLEHKIQKLCFVSSIAALGQNENGAPVTEDILWKPSKNLSAYSLSKYHSEMEIWRGITEGLNAVIVNPSVIIGPGDWSKGSPSFFEFVAKGLSFYTEGTNGFVHINDVVIGMVKAMESDYSAERFTLSSENISYLDFFTYIAKSLGKKPPSHKAGTFILNLAQKYEWLSSYIQNCEPKITKDTIVISRKKASYSNQKSIEKLGLTYKPIINAINEVSEIYKRDKQYF